MKRRKFLYTGLAGIAGTSFISAGLPTNPINVRNNASKNSIINPEAKTNDFDRFEEYEKLFAQALIDTPKRNPAFADERAEIINRTKSILGVSNEMLPEIAYKKVGETERGNFIIEHLTFESWKNVFGAANLYMPDNKEPLPFVLLCCGHGAGCKLHSSYQLMAEFLASNGIAVLVPDNIGQGERESMGHSESAAPFLAGLSLQGLIVMEHIAHLNEALKERKFDPGKIAAIGNSGGGTATCFLGALVPGLSAMVSSGYPSTFSYTARKERKHCCCNILPGIVGELEMWQLYGCFAPKPLFIYNGINDNMFPWDLFKHITRKIKHVYDRYNSTDNFRHFEAPGLHSWDFNRIQKTGEFLSSVFKINLSKSIPEKSIRILTKNNIEKWPIAALDVAGIVRQLTYINVNQNIKVEDLFNNISAENDSSKRVFSQFQLFLNGMKSNIT
jgi:hypothetical protein